MVGDVVGLVVVVAWFALRSLSGSPWWMVHVCHGMPHRQLHSRTNLCFLQALHQVLWLSLLMSNLSFVPSTANLQLGHCSKIMSGSLTRSSLSMFGTIGTSAELALIPAPTPHGTTLSC